VARGARRAASAEFEDFIRDNVGARPWHRDAIDARMIEQALSHQGAIIDSEE
jgi:hypothetical protein